MFWLYIIPHTDIKKSYRTLQDFEKEELSGRRWRSTIYSFFLYDFHVISLKCISLKL